MSTPNFRNINARNIYAYGETRYYTAEDIEANDMDADMIGEYDEDGTRLDAEFCEECAFDLLAKKGYEATHKSDGDRYYSGEIFAEKDVEFSVCGVDMRIRMQAIRRSGYYEGANFDYDADLRIYEPRDTSFCCSYDEDYELFGKYAVDADDVLHDNWLGNKGLSKIHAKRIINAIYSRLADLQDEIEAVYSEACSRKLACVAMFSNGEAIYGNAI